MLLANFGDVTELTLIPEYGAAKVIFSHNMAATTAAHDLNYCE